jgi:photoactive yellow protein
VAGVVLFGMTDPRDAASPNPDVDAVLEVVDAMSPGELDGLPYGVIQLDRTGRILKYNAVESRLASLAPEDAVGKQFFTEIAPCTRVQEFYGRFKEGVIREVLDTSFKFHFAFKQAPRDVTVRLFFSKRTRTVWVLISDHEGKPLDASGREPAGPADTE